MAHEKDNEMIDISYKQHNINMIKCEYCDFKIENKSEEVRKFDLQMHVKFMHLIDKDDDDNVNDYEMIDISSKQDKINMLKCDYCNFKVENKSVNSSMEIRTHIKSMHFTGDSSFRQVNDQDLNINNMEASHTVIDDKILYQSTNYLYWQD